MKRPIYKLLPADFSTAVWRRFAESLRERIESLRDDLEALDEAEAVRLQVRGRLSECRYLLSLGDPDGQRDDPPGIGPAGEEGETWQ